jgi:SAM-dependent methyltransferase
VRNARARLRGPETAIGAQSAGLEVDRAVAYARSSYRSLFELGGLTADELRGARVLELGPGDNLGLAVQLVDAGAEEAVCVDRFVIRFDPAKRDAIHRRLVGGEPPLERIRLLAGVGAETASEALRGERFDLVVSIAALQYLEDPDAAFGSLDELLVPGGRMLHQVDLSDHGLFTGAGRHPLEWLSIGERTYRAMTSHVPAPNRRLIDDYRRLLGAMGYEYEIAVRSRLDADVEAVRPRLLPRYRDLPAEDLRADSIFVTARKSGGTPPTALRDGEVAARA